MNFGESDTMRTLRDSFGRLVAESLTRWGASDLLGRVADIPVDVAESDDELVVFATLPGVRPQDLEITLRDTELTLRAVVPPIPEPPRAHWLVRERRTGTLERSLTLSGPVDVEKMVARYDDGVVRLTLPRAARTPPRRIQVSPSAPHPPEAARTQEEHHDHPFVSHADVPGGADEVTTASDHSFPASDPPSWTPERA